MQASLQSRRTKSCDIICCLVQNKLAIDQNKSVAGVSCVREFVQLHGKAKIETEKYICEIHLVQSEFFHDN